MQPDVDKLGVKEFKEPAIMIPSDDDKKTVDLRKWKIIGVVAVVITFLIIGGIIGTVYLTGYAINNNKIERTVFLKSSNKPTLEKVSVDTDKQTEDLQLENNKLRVIHDFKKGLSMYRMMTEGESVCVVTPLERTYVQHPNAMMKALKNEDGSDEVQTADLANDTYTADEDQDDDATFLYRYEQEEVKDRSIFPLAMREACADNKMYWAVKSDRKGDDTTTVRDKRARYRCYCFRIRIRRGIRVYYIRRCRCWRISR